jgi:hypothetical protein
MSTVAQAARPASAPPRPRPVLRFYVEGQEVDGEAFWRAIRDLGGRATITAVPPRALREDPRYTLTEPGRAALARPQEGGR